MFSCKLGAAWAAETMQCLSWKQPEVRSLERCSQRASFDRRSAVWVV